ncbi:MAG: MBL fold metallo-hydrolase [Proteobacteria bacterium]|nr:MBL fold metallo-hydrolase [Pseudomonadota bacterium]
MIRTLAVALGLSVVLSSGTTFAAVSLAPEVDLIPGEFTPGTQPDGNTIVIRGRDGLLVFDTGRHREHTQAIIDFARGERLSVKVIVNSHWHLDHVGGNPMLREAFPDARVYASGAIDAALHGFLADYRVSLQKQLDAAADDTAKRATRDELAIIDAGTRLRPDKVITLTAERDLAGRKVRVGLARDAVTAGDVWLFDPASGVLASGDLVTLPVPFLDTACPEGWRKALDTLHAVPFKLVVPGHGEPMHRKQFEAYRTAFGNLLNCAVSARTKGQCADEWLHDVGPLVPASRQKFAHALMDYYMDKSLRADAQHTAALCAAT